MGIGLADVLVKGKLPRGRAWFVGIGHGEGDCLCAGAFDLGAKPVKPVTVRIAFKAMYDINASVHVSPPSDGLRLLSKSLPASVYYTMFVYVLLFVAVSGFLIKLLLLNDICKNNKANNTAGAEGFAVLFGFEIYRGRLKKRFRNSLVFCALPLPLPIRGRPCVWRCVRKWSRRRFRQ